MNKNRLIFIGIGVILGGLAGYAYYHFVGCVSGTCAITTKPFNSTIYGMLMGGLLVDLIRDLVKKKSQNEN